MSLSTSFGKMSVLLVDDSPESIDVLGSMLVGEYRTRIATSGTKALQIACSDDPPDLILLDVVMPNMDGYEVCRILKENPTTVDIPIIFLTAKNDVASEEIGFALGAVDFIAKPISPPIVKARIRTHLELKHVRDFLRDQNEFLEMEIARRTREIVMIQDVAMVAMGSLAETRDNETGKHIQRTQQYVKELANHLALHTKFSRALDRESILQIFKSAPLHDIGKVGIPDSILLKPGQLDRDEFAIMQRHTIIGRNAIQTAERLLDTPGSFLKVAREIAYSHHERWDGAGYPEGLSGEDIPICGRVMAVADVYDALRSQRIYKPSISHDESVGIIKNGAGAQFDPDVVSAFTNMEHRFEEISKAYADS